MPLVASLFNASPSSTSPLLWSSLRARPDTFFVPWASPSLAISLPDQHPFLLPRFTSVGSTSWRNHHFAVRERRGGTSTHRSIRVPTANSVHAAQSVSVETRAERIRREPPVGYSCCSPTSRGRNYQTGALTHCSAHHASHKCRKNASIHAES